MTKKILVTGGAGFIGFHVVKTFYEKGFNIVIIDNLSRKGTEVNLATIKERFNVKFYKADIRDYQTIVEIVKKEKPFDAFIHLAAQVAVTTSVLNPKEDFEINAVGTFNLLEALRNYIPEALFLYSSTNKVYGSLEDIKVIEKEKRYEFEDIKGVNEKRQLDFHSPYGCSKGAADQYVIDYGRIYDLHTVSFRQSCIYGQNQFGIEDQGWVAWFIIAGILKRPVTIYGDGKQVRDLLYVNDLVDLYWKALQQKENIKGRAYNIGGGYNYTLSLLELLEILKQEGIILNYQHAGWRPGDQKVFVSDNTKAKQELGWEPVTPPPSGIKELIAWVREHKDIINNLLG